MQLYTFFQSGSAYRVRIALALKSIEYEPVYVVIGGNSADLSDPEYLALNPSGVVPTLVDGNVVLNQTIAIMEYLEETHPEPPLLPAELLGRAPVRALALAVACEIHPLQNLRVLNCLTDDLGHGQEERRRWAAHWIETGFAAIETLLAGGPETGRFCHGDAPTLADVVLVPQVYNARRFEVDLAPYPTIRRIEAACLALPAFDAARPENQPDAE